MKFRKLASILAVISLLLAMAATPVTVGAQEPTEEPTEEPTAEPTEEPAAEPTEEPTAEPTEEATEEPTEEPTAEPTEEATEEPTEEPTAEPTEEATAEPTVEPTAEPTVEPTVEPESSPAAEGDIGAQADPGSWTTTYIGIQNLENSASDSVLTLYSGGGSTPINKTIYPLGAVHVTSDEIPEGRYAGVIESSTQVAAGVINVNTTGAADAYSGESNPGTRFTIPLIFRLYSGGWSSTIHIQNASSSDGLTVYVNTYIAGQATAAYVATRSIDANESVSVDISETEFSPFGSNYGYAVITSTQNIAVVNENFRNAAGLYQATFFTGLPDSAAGRQLSAPLVFNQYSGGWNTGVQIVNVDSVATTVVMTYTTSGGTSYVRSQDFAAGESKAFYLPSQSLPADSFGSVAIGSDDADVVALANAAKYAGGSVGYAAIMLNPAIATNKVAVPLAFNGSATSSWLTGIQAVNLDSVDQEITATFVREDVDPSIAGNTIVKTAVAGANGGQATFYMPSLGIGSFAGAVFIESNGPVMALGSNTFYPNGYAANLNGVNY